MKTIGVIGKKALKRDEKLLLAELGSLVAKLGHQLAIIPTPGVAAQVRAGYELEGLAPVILDQGVIEHSDHTLIYPDKRLLDRLQHNYPALLDMNNVDVIDNLQEWVEATRTLLAERQ